MSVKISMLRRPLIRRIPNSTLVATITAEGVILRGFRRRKSKFFSWEQIASLADQSKPLLKVCESGDGLQVLRAMGATIAPESTANA